MLWTAKDFCMHVMTIINRLFFPFLTPDVLVFFVNWLSSHLLKDKGGFNLLGRVQFIFAIQVSIFYPCNENNKKSCSRWEHYCLHHIFEILSTPVSFVCCSLCWIWRISINWQWWKMILENIPSKLRWEKNPIWLRLILLLSSKFLFILSFLYCLWRMLLNL